MGKRNKVVKLTDKKIDYVIRAKTRAKKTKQRNEVKLVLCEKCLDVLVENQDALINRFRFENFDNFVNWHNTVRFHESFDTKWYLQTLDIAFLSRLLEGCKLGMFP